MRIRIIESPTRAIAGVSLDRFRVGHIYDVRRQIACIALAEGWAETLPDGSDASRDVRPPPSHEVPAIKGLVVVVDDETELQRLMAHLLTIHGYYVVMTGYGEEPIERLCKHCPDVIVLDLNRDGWRVHAEHLLLTDNTLSVAPVLLRNAATGAARPIIQAVGVVKKPFDAARLFVSER